MNLNNSNLEASKNKNISSSLEDLHRQQSTETILANNELERASYSNQSSFIPTTSFSPNLSLDEDIREVDSNATSASKKVSTIKQISKIRIKSKKNRETPQVIELPQIIEPFLNPNEMSKKNSLAMPPVYSKGQRRESFLHRAEFESFELGQKVRKSSMNSNDP